MEKMGCLLVVLLFVVKAAIAFLFVSLLTYIVCLAFGFQWSWFLALGIWAIVILLRFIISAAKGE